MKFIRLTILISMLGIGIFMGGCGGGGAEVRATNTTIGQELQDLKASFDQGIITEKEYKSVKKDIINRYD